MLQLLSTFLLECTLIVLTLAKILRQGHGFPSLVLATFFAIEESQLILRTRVSRIQAGGLLQPFLGRGQVALLEVCESQVIGRVRKWWLGCRFAQVPDRACEVPGLQIQAAQVVEHVGMV